MLLSDTSGRTMRASNHELEGGGFPQMLHLLTLVFFLSGTAALLFETLWFHQAGLALGNSIWASSLVLASFMGGLALGNASVIRAGSRIQRPIALYAGLELVIGVTGVSLVYLLPQLTPILSSLLSPFLDEPWVLNPLRLVSSFVLMLLPATAMGATLPLLVTAFYRHNPHFGRVLGRLYGLNTLGAVIGALAGSFFAIELWGVRGSALFAALLNGIAALLALAASRKLEVPTAAPGRSSARATPRARALLGAGFASGLILLGLEVIWFRFGQLFFPGTDTAFSVMLAVVLSGIGLGGLLGARWLALRADAARDVPALALLSGVLCIALFLSLDRVLGSANVVPPLILSFVLMFPIALLSGVLFTLLGEAIHEQVGDETRAAGMLTLANTTGAMLGPLLAGFAILPSLGMEQSLRLLGCGYAAVCLLAWQGGLRPKTRFGTLTAAALALSLVAATALFPTGFLREHYITRALQGNDQGGKFQPVEIREGLTDTIIYLQYDAWGLPLSHRMLTNNYSMAGTSLQASRYMSLFVYWPVAVHPDMKKALLISYGVGVTAKALTRTESFESIDVVDTSADVLEMNRIVYPDPKELPLNDPRVTVHVDDGRYFLQTTDQRFDLITGEPPPPKIAGVVNLYTREYFELLRSRLAEGGIATYWLPVHGLLPSDTHAIIRAFCDAFDDCSLWGGSALDWILIGTRNAMGPVSEDDFARQWHDPVVGPRLREIGVERPEQLGSLFMAGAEDLAKLTASTPPLTDDHPKRLSAARVPAASLRSAYRPLMDAETASLRFASDPAVTRLWPPELRISTLPFFEIQTQINRFFLGDSVSEEDELAMFRQLFDDSPLPTFARWQLGSSVRQEQLARIASEAGHPDPELHYHLGIAALADRNFERAAEHFAKLRHTGNWTRKIAFYDAYALCLTRKTEPARHSLSLDRWYLLREACRRGGALGAPTGP